MIGVFNTSLDRATPGLFVWTGALVGKFGSEKWWTPPLDASSGSMAARPHVEVANGFYGRDDHCPHHPSFVLNDSAQMERLRGSIWNALHGRPYFNPFWREHGWYCVTVSSVDGLREMLEDEIRSLYESGGHRVLVLFEEDGLDDAVRRAGDFIAEFRACHDTDDSGYSLEGGLGDLALKCLASPTPCFNDLDDAGRAAVVDEIAAEYASQPALMDWNSVAEDLEVWRSLRGAESIHQPCFAGNVLINTFIRSRFDCHQKNSHRKTINAMWADTDLMKEVLMYELTDGRCRFHSKRILACMMFRHRFRSVSNLNQCFVYMKCRPYAKEGGLFYDPCAGWGGRMLAAYALGMKYVAIDANRRLVDELRELARYMGYDAEITYGDSSDRDCVMQAMGGRKADLAFTCPPYWREEWYSDDPFQSNIKCRSKAEWHGSFLSPMIFNTLEVTDGPFIMSFDEKIEIDRVPGICAERMEHVRMNDKKEDKYYFIRRK